MWSSGQFLPTWTFYKLCLGYCSPNLERQGKLILCFPSTWFLGCAKLDMVIFPSLGNYLKLRVWKMGWLAKNLSMMLYWMDGFFFEASNRMFCLGCIVALFPMLLVGCDIKTWLGPFKIWPESLSNRRKTKVSRMDLKVQCRETIPRIL